MKHNISRLHDCYGCGICVHVCPINIISLKCSDDGFFAPEIRKQDKCIECGLCLKVCAYNHKELGIISEEMTYKAGWSNNPIVRQRCSSGGIGFELGFQLMKCGYLACGVKYNISARRAEHFIADSPEQFAQSMGSKYIQSYPIDALKEISKDKKYFFVGTPCQIDSFRRYIRHFKIEDNFILMDFFCHGVPSYLLWYKYVSELERKIGKLEFVAWRNKTTGWQDSWSINADSSIAGESINRLDFYSLKVNEKKHFYQSRWKGGDLFYKLFLGNYCLNRCCYTSCKYKCISSVADIRIGDLWGKKYQNDQKGVNGIIAFTEKGNKVLQQLENCTFESATKKIVLEGQMSRSPMRPIIYNKILKQLRSKKSLQEINDGIIRGYRIYSLPKRIINYVCFRLNMKPLIH